MLISEVTISSELGLHACVDEESSGTQMESKDAWCLQPPIPLS